MNNNNNNNIKNINTVVTHSGRFHIDEIFAIAFIQKFINPDLEIKRTREKEVIKEGKKDLKTAVIDVGREFNPNSLIFDHHQDSFKQVWDKDNYNLSKIVPLSSTGIIFNYLLENNIFKDKGLNEEHINFIRDNYIIPIDSHDNGIEIFQELSFICNFNVKFKENSDSKKEQQFFKALSMAQIYLDNILDRAVEYEIKKENVQRQVRESVLIPSSQGNITVVVSEKGAGADMSLAMDINPDIDFFVTQKKEGQYAIQTAPKNKKNPFSMKNPVPDKISEDFENKKDLSYVTKASVEFIHKAKFITVLNGSLEDVMDYIKNIQEFEKNLNNSRTLSDKIKP